MTLIRDSRNLHPSFMSLLEFSNGSQTLGRYLVAIPDLIILNAASDYSSGVI